MKYLREPEPWLQRKTEGRLPKGSILDPYLELLRDSSWRKNLIVGALISSTGVIGLWAIGEYATDLQENVFRTVLTRRRMCRRPRSSDGRERAVQSRFLLQMIGAAVGMWFMTKACIVLGRKPAFAIWYVGALDRDAVRVLDDELADDAYWMMPLMGSSSLAYSPGSRSICRRLFPSRMRSTGTSFCYNLGRFAAAGGSFFSAELATEVFGQRRFAASGTLCGDGDVRDFPGRPGRAAIRAGNQGQAAAGVTFVACRISPRSVAVGNLPCPTTLPLVSRTQPLPVVRAGRRRAGLAVRLPRSAVVRPGAPAGDDENCWARPTRRRSMPTAATPPRSF